jgi:hypothetical protein
LGSRVLVQAGHAWYEGSCVAPDHNIWTIIAHHDGVPSQDNQSEDSKQWPLTRQLNHLVSDIYIYIYIERKYAELTLDHFVLCKLFRTWILMNGIQFLKNDQKQIQFWLILKFIFQKYPHLPSLLKNPHQESCNNYYKIDKWIILEDGRNVRVSFYYLMLWDT